MIKDQIFTDDPLHSGEEKVICHTADTDCGDQLFIEFSAIGEKEKIEYTAPAQKKTGCRQGISQYIV